MSTITQRPSRRCRWPKSRFASSSGYVNDPNGAQGADHPDYGSGPLETLAQRDAFRSSLPPGTHMAAVNDLIARGCPAAWIRAHV
ncbi:MAG: hypothetical protein JO057_01880 [Chloroflexi bacterium]|nr:hypothetical protein [Chloroflexota bacterium]